MIAERVELVGNKANWVGEFEACAGIRRTLLLKVASDEPKQLFLGPFLVGKDIV